MNECSPSLSSIFHVVSQLEYLEWCCSIVSYSTSKLFNYTHISLSNYNCTRNLSLSPRVPLLLNHTNHALSSISSLLAPEALAFSSQESFPTTTTRELLCAYTIIQFGIHISLPKVPTDFHREDSSLNFELHFGFSWTKFPSLSHSTSFFFCSHDVCECVFDVLNARDVLV